eukprot:evm.model.scf_398.5 EVM.evm.TU.scf_398.5   scf_398:36009-37127(+)
MLEFERLHKSCLEERRGLLLSCMDEVAIVLAPLNAIDNNKNILIFWGYCIASSFSATLFDHGQLPLILDLDETVVMGHSTHTMKQKMASLEQEIKRAHSGHAFCD